MCFLPRLLKLKGNVRISRNWLLSIEWRITWPQFQWILLLATTASLGGLWPLESLDSMTKLWNVSTLKMCIFHHTIFCFRFRGFTNPRHDIIYTGHSDGVSTVPHQRGLGYKSGREWSWVGVLLHEILKIPSVTWLELSEKRKVTVSLRNLQITYLNLILFYKWT